VADIESLSCYPSIATLAAAFIERWFAHAQRTISDPWLRWLLSPRFDEVCRAIWENPEGFMVQFRRLTPN